MEDRPSLSLDHDVEHQAFLPLLAHEAGVTVPAVEALTQFARRFDGSRARDVGGRRSTSPRPRRSTTAFLDAVWRKSASCTGAHRSPVLPRREHPRRRWRPVSSTSASAGVGVPAPAASTGPSCSSSVAVAGAEPASLGAAGARPGRRCRGVRSSSRWRSRRRRGSRRRSRCSRSCARGRGHHRRGAGAARTARPGAGPTSPDDRGARPARSTCSSRSSPTSATASPRCATPTGLAASRARPVRADLRVRAIALVGGVPHPSAGPTVEAQMASSFVNRVSRRTSAGWR